MVIEVVAFEDIQDRRKFQERPVGYMYRTQFIDHRREPALGPHVFMIENSENRSLDTHFHDVDQFQIVIGGNGSLGKHALAPYSVHFARAFTPYGPLVSGSGGGGLAYITVRARTDPVPKAQRLPQHRSKLENMPNRKPWQVTGHASFGRSSIDDALQPVEGVSDAYGMAAYTLELAAGQEATSTAPVSGDGQCIVILQGSMIHNNVRKRGVTVIFVPPGDRSFQIKAGEEGLKAVVLNFPKPQSELAGQLDRQVKADGVFQCDLCAFSYSEEDGYPEGGILPGTRWEDVPKDFACPDCSAGKEDFSKLDF